MLNQLCIELIICSTKLLKLEKELKNKLIKLRKKLIFNDVNKLLLNKLRLHDYN